MDWFSRKEPSTPRDYVRALRKLGMSDGQIASAIGFSRPQVNLVANGRQSGVRMLPALASLYASVTAPKKRAQAAPKSPARAPVARDVRPDARSWKRAIREAEQDPEWLEDQARVRAERDAELYAELDDASGISWSQALGAVALSIANAVTQPNTPQELQELSPRARMVAEYRAYREMGLSDAESQRRIQAARLAEQLPPRLFARQPGVRASGNTPPHIPLRNIEQYVREMRANPGLVGPLAIE
jgi:transcriptional regulator with XRE-family HTH domain